MTRSSSIIARCFLGVVTCLTLFAFPAQSLGASTEAGAFTPRRVLYVSTLNFQSGAGSIIVYPAYARDPKPLYTITIATGIAEGLWTAKNGDLYAAIVNAGSNGQGLIYAYKPGATSPFRTYTQGIDGPSDGAFDAAGNLYVSNLCGPPGQGTGSCFVFADRSRARSIGYAQDLKGYVAVFPRGKMRPSTYLEGSINLAEGVAVDPHGNVFVSNFTGQSPACQVLEFQAGSHDDTVLPLQSLKNTICYKELFDSSGDLVLADEYVLTYPQPYGQLGGMLTNGILVAMGMSWGPDGTLFVGNYLINNNEGNAIAFPPGSTSPARTFAVPNGDAVLGIAEGPAL
ncbi:MAG TPA: hypothetical protein VEV38_03170 [Candidatus Eremiobacteraceae bacterium]|nr:hypothetical protein [Candidatus Eremiobacteraceae bacterium]